MRGVQFPDALTAAQAGEEWAFAALYRDFAPAVLGFLRGRVPNEAEDVASSVWLEVARSIGRFMGDEAGFRAWLFTIVRRRMMNEFRRRRRDWSEPQDPAVLVTVLRSVRLTFVPSTKSVMVGASNVQATPQLTSFVGAQVRTGGAVSTTRTN